MIRLRWLVLGVWWLGVALIGFLWLTSWVLVFSDRDFSILLAYSALLGIWLIPYFIYRRLTRK